MNGYDDDYQEMMEEQQELQEDQMDAAQEEAWDYPRSRKPDSLFSLFKQVLLQEDSTKVGNLDKLELGMLPLSVRECQRIGLLARSFDHEEFAKFFEMQGQIILATSASKKGWFTELFVSQKKLTQRAKLHQVSKEGKRWFGKKKEATQPMEA